jgi:phosphoglycolate phosphatase
MKPLKAVLFDLDGTLLDTAPDFSFVLDTMMARRQRPPVPYAKVRQAVSHGARGLVEMAFGLTPDADEFEPLRQELLDLYGSHLADSTRLFDGLDELLDLLEQRGVAWGIATNKPALYAEPLLRQLELASRCAVLVCPDHVTHRKPHPESLQLACQRIGCELDEAIYIGDHRRDIECGINAGVPTIAVAYGYVHDDDPCALWGADAIALDAADILRLLQPRLP